MSLAVQADGNNNAPDNGSDIVLMTFSMAVAFIIPEVVDIALYIKDAPKHGALKWFCVAELVFIVIFFAVFLASRLARYSEKKCQGYCQGLMFVLAAAISAFAFLSVVYSDHSK